MKLSILLFFPILSFSQNFTAKEIARYEAQARRVNIVRDHWGVPHIYGKTDADAVFGVLYAQCEENFKRVEENNLEMLGRQSELYGENYLFSDLRMRMIYDSSAAVRDYKRCPAWFRKLLDAASDGVNFYLYKHPEVKPAVLKRFEPWYQLMRTDGSISATQTGNIGLQETRNFYAPGGSSMSFADDLPSPPSTMSGSNGFAVSPSRTASGNTILYINPHVTFYFRTEMHMVSDEGLNSYGAITWGQFFIYQGFNQHCGWMHTSSYADVADAYEETIVKKDGPYYLYDNKLRKLRSKKLTVFYKSGDKLVPFTSTTYYSHHGPILGERNGKWLSLRENNRSLSSLMQSWLRTKVKTFAEFQKVMDMRINNSNNTVYADDQGNIAYWHGNYMPRRDPELDWSRPVDGSSSKTEWQGLHAVKETVHIYNPPSGWIQNCNSTPFTAAGENSPRKENYPAYMAPDGQNARALNAMRLLSPAKGLTIEKMINEIGYDRYLTAFDILFPSFFSSYEGLSAKDSLKLKLAEPISILKHWDRQSSTQSIASTIAIEWAQRLLQLVPRAATSEEGSNSIGRLNFIASNLTIGQKLQTLNEVVESLEKRFGTWKIAWGDLNRFQRVSGEINQHFDDAKPSLPSGLGPSGLGSLPAFESRATTANKLRYGYSGNSFIACVEFGKRLRAKTVTTAGQSHNPNSKHFTDQAEMYLKGEFKEILFYKEDVMKNARKSYRPGELGEGF